MSPSCYANGRNHVTGVISNRANDFISDVPVSCDPHQQIVASKSHTSSLTCFEKHKFPTNYQQNQKTCQPGPSLQCAYLVGGGLSHSAHLCKVYLHFHSRVKNCIEGVK